MIINDREEILLLAHPELGGGWQVVNGALEAGETALEGVLREISDEAGDGCSPHQVYCIILENNRAKITIVILWYCANDSCC